MSDVCIVGHFGGNKIFNDGQTVKTKTLYKSLNEKNLKVDCVDTYYVKKNPILFFFILLVKTFENQRFIILLSFNGRKILFPYFSFISNVFKKEIFHDVIGFKLVDEAENSSKIRKYLNSFQSNWVEGRVMKERLENCGVKNAMLVPNYRNIYSVGKIDASEISTNNKFKFCTFSRVIPEKGIEDAINAVESLNAKYGIELDIYGPVAEDYKERFFSVIEKSKHCSYKGIVEADEGVPVLKKYFCLLFPTYWKSEGMPGTIIDAFASGLPIIARRWPLCDELITDGKTGLVYDFDKPEMLVEKVEYAITHKDEIINMKKNCLEESKKYSEEVVVNQILELSGIER